MTYSRSFRPFEFTVDHVEDQDERGGGLGAASDLKVRGPAGINTARGLSTLYTIYRLRAYSTALGPDTC
jgi:hypothetical protein